MSFHKFKWSLRGLKQILTTDVIAPKMQSSEHLWFDGELKSFFLLNFYNGVTVMIGSCDIYEFN